MGRLDKQVPDPRFEMLPLPQRMLLSAATVLPAAWLDTPPTTPAVSAKASLATTRQAQPAQRHVQRAPVTVSLTMDRTRFSTGEPILLTFTVSNHSKKTIFFDTPFTPFYYPAEALVVKSGTQEATWAGSRIQFVWGKSEFRPVRAGGSIRVTIDLNALYTSDQTNHLPGLAPGQWSVRLLTPRYWSGPLSAVHSWSRLKSAPAVGSPPSFVVSAHPWWQWW